ncbi:hypothetical protein HanRHA438_Chr05g0214291 [Helianthus annuus]|nr:hypothetical protein HanHA300_Chr05g0167871 [Helianthus annuus]KAJ0583892.1 hypothetical protein HanHA89_Chr05g0181921 [Helianthus annuus]KAJ0629007.1 hypothetical protein HanIR_Chr00c29g0911941 [Helianthus annuus]KAJ0749593.1 hypothetical protein HanLR1_Chr05g0171771 [Helianthus annuus]KAJ0918147.1 hypothetical protein HanRHA438_Chr05g0214291 [Helianthus annuus]
MYSVGAAGVRSTFVWNRWTPLKVNFLSWRHHLDRFPTKAALARRWITDAACGTCWMRLWTICLWNLSLRSNFGTECLIGAGSHHAYFLELRTY